MSFFLLGRKIGMTKLFKKNGNFLPISIIDVSNNYILSVKFNNLNNFYIIKIIFGKKKNFIINKSLLGNYLKCGIKIGYLIKEIKIYKKLYMKNKIKVGNFLNENLFFKGQKIDIKGISIGKGFSGTIKRYNFSSGRASHGNSRSHNVPGSIGMCQDPGRVFPGKKMPGHLGNKKCTVQNLNIYRINYKYHLILISGHIPGYKNNIIIISPAIKFNLKK